MGLFVIIFGASAGIIMFAWGVDNGFEIFDEWRAKDKLKKVRVLAARFKTAVVQHHHGSHRRIKVS